MAPRESTKRGRDDAIARPEGPRQRAVEVHGVQLRIEGTDVDDAVADRHRRAHVVTGREPQRKAPSGAIA